jgi:phosphinothricin acetyltransferase
METPTPLTVRSSTAEDIPAITEIYAREVETGLATFELSPPDAGEMTRRRVALLGDDMPYLVAEIDGRVAGYAYAGLYRPRPAYRFTIENSVYVADWARRRGVARALMLALIEVCEAAGRRQMMAVISAGDASIALHAALGFVEVGRMQAVGWKFDRWVDVTVMQRALGPGSDQPPPS